MTREGSTSGPGGGPLERGLRALDAVNRAVGAAVAWLALALVLVQFAIVVLRYVFALGFVPMQESVLYLHGCLFMLGAGWTLARDGHVRVDVFYRGARPRTRALVDLIGVCVFLLPVCVATGWLSFGYVANAWRVFEGSPETSGLPLVWLLKTVILVFTALLAGAGLALGIRSARLLAERGDDGGRERP